MISRNLALMMLLLVGSCSSSNNVPSQNLDGVEFLGNILNSAIPRFKDLYDSKGFYVKDGRPINFFVYDLIDTTNNSYPAKSPIKLSKNGVYHFSPIRYRISYSHLAIIVDGKIRVFRFLNCDDGDKIGSVIEYVKENLNYEDVVINRIINYRSYSKFFKTDPQSRVECP
jgi:hypothetical protein